jgi:hypothetical protein
MKHETRNGDLGQNRQNFAESKYKIFMNPFGPFC